MVHLFNILFKMVSVLTIVDVFILHVLCMVTGICDEKLGYK